MVIITSSALNELATILSLKVKIILPGLATFALAAGVEAVSLRWADAGVAMATMAAGNRKRIMNGSKLMLVSLIHA